MTITKERSVNEGEDERVQGATICKLESLLKRSHLQRIMKRKKIFTYLCNESVPSRNCVSTRQRQRLQGNVHQCGRPRSESTDNSISIYLPCLTNLPTWNGSTMQEQLTAEPENAKPKRWSFTAQFKVTWYHNPKTKGGGYH